MVESVYGNLRAALDLALTQVPGLPQVARGNVDFDPRPDQTFVRAQFTPVRRRPSARGPDPEMAYLGLYNVVVCSPQNEGEGPGMSVAEKIVEEMDGTKSFSYGGNVVRIEYAEMGLPYPDPPHYCTPVTISWYSYH